MSNKYQVRTVYCNGIERVLDVGDPVKIAERYCDGLALMLAKQPIVQEGSSVHAVEVRMIDIHPDEDLDLQGLVVITSGVHPCDHAA